MPEQEVVIHWFRRDLRLDDNHALYTALQSGYPVLPVFIFDRNILDKLNNEADARVTFIHQQLEKINKKLHTYGSSLIVLHDRPVNGLQNLISRFKIKAVFTNRDYEPYATERDDEIAKLLASHKIKFHQFKDQVIYDTDEIVKADGKPYTVYTPYSNKWKAKLDAEGIPEYPSEKIKGNWFRVEKTEIPSLKSIGFKKTENDFPPAIVNDALIRNYKSARDFPALNGTSHLSIHLRFGTASIRQMVNRAMHLSDTWLNELCWREFYMMILWHFPQVVNNAFKPAYDRIGWRNNEHEFELWKAGKTGYPIVDAGMRELSATGFMHNRVRMITASFLTKHLLIDWRWGEAWFAEKLLDFELSSNNGGWQWAAGSGCDAAPYFRIFNPYEQTRKFDPEFKYIRKWVPEFEDFGYPPPVVDHKEARERCLLVYSKALKPA